MTELVRRGTILVGVLLALVTSAVAEAAPAPLSDDRSPADVDSTLRQRRVRTLDRRPARAAGLPLHVDQTTIRAGAPAGAERCHRGAAPARQRPHRRHRLQPRLRPAVEPGPAATSGRTATTRRPATTAAATATCNVGGAVLSTLYARPPARRDRPSATSAPATSSGARRRPASTSREQRLRAVRRRPAAAARRDDPQHDARDEAGVVVRVLGREPVLDRRTSRARASGSPTCDPADADADRSHQAAGDRGDPTPLSDLRRRAARARSTASRPTRARFFGVGGARATPAAVAADALSGSLAPPAPARRPARRCSRSARRVTLAPGETVTLRYAYGMAHARPIARARRASTRARATRSARSQRAWRRWLPRADFGAGAAPGSRASSSGTRTCCAPATTYEEACGHHTITQGGYYQYDLGCQPRLPRRRCSYVLPLIYTEPAIAREDPALLGGGAAAGRRADPVRRCIRCCTRLDLGTSQRPRLLAAAGGGRVRARRRAT